MIGKDLRPAIIHYLGYDPEQNVKQKATRTEAEIMEWNVSEKQPTLEELQTIVNDNKEVWKTEKIQIKKDSKIRTLKREIFIGNGIGEDVTELQTELDELEAK